MKLLKYQLQPCLTRPDKKSNRPIKANKPSSLKLGVFFDYYILFRFMFYNCKVFGRVNKDTIAFIGEN